MAHKIIELEPVRNKPEYFDAIEKAILEHLKKEIYEPLLQELSVPSNILQNSIDDLNNALLKGTITYYRGTFSGRFNAKITKELKKIGAKWDRKTATFSITLKDLPMSVRHSISLSETKFLSKVKAIDKKLSQILPEEIADRLKLEKIFSASIYKIGKDIDATLKGITVRPSLTDESRAVISEQYTQNMKLYIQDFSKKEIVKLREDMQKNVFQGNRYEAMVSTIQKSYDVSLNKAKFLARQETNLLLAKYKETRYQDAGVSKYIWRTVGGSPNHPVRPTHKRLDGKVFEFNNPPVTDEKGNRNNPGEDFGCRCYARPIVEFK